MLEYAIGYWMDGKPIFPVCSATGKGRCIQHGACKHAGKVPLVSWERFQTSLPSKADLEQWWGRHWPQANIGMATGELSGIVVLDVDNSEARKQALGAGLPPTPTVFTGKPGGTHFYLAHPGFRVKNFVRKRPGLDFRGDGGYVVLPPSQHEEGPRYRWVGETSTLDVAAMPAWLLDLFTGAANVEAAADDQETLDLDLILDGIPEGQRDDLLFRYACRLRGDDVPIAYAEQLLRQAARACRPPFEESIAIEKVQRAYREYGPNPVLEVPAGGVAVPGHEAASAPAELSYPIQTLAQLMARPVPENAALVDGLIFAQRTTWMFSDPNSGKTLLGVALGLHIAAGRPFCGLPVKQGAVLLIEEDSSLSVIQEYVEMLADIYGFDLELLPFYINELQGLRVTDARGVALARSAIQAAVELSNGALALVLWDTAETLVPSEKFSSRELDPFGQCLRQNVNNGIANTVLDHTRKPPQQGAKGTPWKPPTEPSELLELLYGSRAKSAISDVMLHLSGGFKGGGVRATFCKMRGELPAPFSLTFEPDTGFGLSAPPRSTRTPTEQKIIKWLNSIAPGWYPLAEILSGAGVPERSGKRAMVAMKDRRLLERDDSRTDKQGALYRLNPAPEAAFS